MHANEGSAGLRSVTPVFSTADVARWLEHYRSLGFEVEAHDDEYGFASLDSIDIHVSRNPDHDPLTTAGCAYLHVEDADALYRRWSTASGSRDIEPANTDYGIREGAHLDPDNNLLRYGSRL